MSDASDEWARWEAMTGFRRRVREYAEKHRIALTVTPEEYLAQKQGELARKLEGKNLIYLDTKHWVNLCRVVVHSPQFLPIYDEILGLLRLLRRKDCICCPVSSPLFEELMKQTDRATRLATAKMMDELSGGVCVRSWLDLVQFEFAKHVHRTLRGGDVEAGAFPAWTKAGFWAGDHTVGFPELSMDDNALMEKVHIDLRWEMTFEECQSIPEWIPTPDMFTVAWVQESNQVKACQTESKLSFNKLVRQRRRQLFAALKDPFVLMLPALCRGLPGSPAEHVATILDPIYEGRNPNALPFLEIVAGLDAAIALESTRKVQVNDMLDYLHAAQALPYCDALFCDNYMAQKMRNKPLEFGRIFDTEVGSRPEEIACYLKRLA